MTAEAFLCDRCPGTAHYADSEIGRRHAAFGIYKSTADRLGLPKREFRQMTESTSSSIPAIAEAPKRDDSHLPVWALTGRKTEGGAE